MKVSRVVAICHWCWGDGSPERRSVSAYWASWAHSLPVIFVRHPGVAHCFVEQLEGNPLTSFLSAAAASVRILRGTMGFDPPTWQSLCEGARPELLEPDDFEPGMERGGWQHEAASRVERQFREEVLFEQMTPQARALVRSQSGPGGNMALTTAPTSVLTKIPPHLFRVVLLRRLRLPLPLSQHPCRCGRPIDPCRMRQDGSIGTAGVYTRKCCS